MCTLESAVLELPLLCSYNTKDEANDKKGEEVVHTSRELDKLLNGHQTHLPLSHTSSSMKMDG